VARLRPFLTGTILFSSISPNYEQNLKEELFACHMFMKIPFDVLDRMPIRDRKYYIKRYNQYMEERENAANNTSSTSDISMYTNMSQGVVGDEIFE
jgi:hypothetical protein